MWYMLAKRDGKKKYCQAMCIGTGTMKRGIWLITRLIVLIDLCDEDHRGRNTREDT